MGKVICEGLQEHYQRILNKPEEEIFFELVTNRQLLDKMNGEIVSDKRESDYDSMSEVVVFIRQRYFKVYIYRNSYGEEESSSRRPIEVFPKTKEVVYYE